MTSDKLSRGEKLTLTFLATGQVLSIFIWYLGSEAAAATVGPLLPWIRLVFAVVASAALDLVVVTTTIGRRDGRRSRWSWATILSAAAFSAMIALDTAGGPTIGPFLHVAYAVNIFLFAQHTAIPRNAAQQAATVAQLEQEIAQTRATAAQQSAALAQARAELDTARRQAAEQAETYAAGLRNQEAEIRRLREAAAQPLDPNALDVLNIARALREARVPLRETADLLRMPESTLRSRLKQTNGVHPTEA